MQVPNVSRDATIAPAKINQLPPELLERAFTFLVLRSPCLISTDSERPLVAILLVCGWWHQVATHIPAFWSHIDVDFYRWAGSHVLKRIQLWLGRCGDIPLDIHVERPDYDEWRAHDPEIVSTLAAAFKTKVDFVKSFHFFGESATPVAHALLCLKSNHLKSNHLTSNKLRSLTADDLWSRGDEPFRSWLPHSLNGLFELSLSRLRPNSCPKLSVIMTVLFNCPMLHTLRFKGLSLPPDESNPSPPIQLNELKLLEIDDFDPNVFPTLMTALHPGVHALDLRLHYDLHDEAHMMAIKSFFLRSNIVSLSLLNKVRVETDRQPVLQSLYDLIPQLRAFRPSYCHGINLTTELVELISSEPGTIPKLPKLQSLCLDHATLYPESVQWLEKLCTARKIRFLVLISCKFLHSNGGKSLFLDLPDDIQRRISEQVGQLIVLKDSPDEIYDGVDQFVEKLVKID